MADLDTFAQKRQASHDEFSCMSQSTCLIVSESGYMCLLQEDLFWKQLEDTKQKVGETCFLVVFETFGERDREKERAIPTSSGGQTPSMRQTSSRMVVIWYP